MANKALRAIVPIAFFLFIASSLAAADDAKKPGFHGWGDSQAADKTPADTESSPARQEGEDRKDIYEQLSREREAFFEETRSMREEIHQKRLELSSELAKSDPDAERAAAVQKEISDRRAELDRKRLEHYFRMKQIDPDVGRGGYGACPNCPFQDRERGYRGGYGMMAPDDGRHRMYGRGDGEGRRMMGPGYGRHHMWGPGYGMGPGYRGGGQGMMDRERTPEASGSGGEVSQSEAGGIVSDYLKSTRNPNLTLGKLTDAGDAYEAEILTKDGSLVDKVLVDKATGYMRPAY